MFDLPNNVIEGEDVICGYITLPERHNQEDGTQIQLAVVIIKSRAVNPKPDPLFMAQGGPGGSTIDTYAEYFLSNDVIFADRDIVLFDQRGTLYSKPTLLCPELDQLLIDIIDKDLADEESEKMEFEAIRSCRDRLLGEGINLSAYNSLENAADINAIRESLGYDQVNLYGVSYGTLLALHTVRHYPHILRSVILDAVLPPQNNFVLESATSMDRAFTQLFQKCANNPECNHSYPELEQEFFDLISKLNNNPARVPMKDPESGITYQAVIDGDTFQSGAFQMLYATGLIPALPRMIYDAREGNFDFFARIMAILLFDRTTSYGMYYSVLCAEDADFDLTGFDLSHIRPQFAESEKDQPALFLKTCEEWNVEPLSSEVDAPVYSDIPTLVLSGGFDPITPPDYGKTVAQTLSNSYEIVFPAGGHGQALEGECQDRIISDFLNNPSRFPNTECISEISKPVFFTSSNLIDVPALIRLLNLEGTTGIELLFLILALLWLLSAVFIFPLVWLMRTLRPKLSIQKSKTAPDGYTAPIVGTLQSVLQPNLSELTPSDAPRESPLIRYAGWIAVLNGITLSIFTCGFFVVIITMIADNDNRLFFGVTSQAWALFILPILSMVFTLAMIMAMLKIWRDHRWGIWGRMYYSSITLAAISCIMILLKWGLFSTLA
jgi:pimeloyl-ACP methyl ester carboxylesterase